MIRLRQDLHFVIFTKRIHRAEKCLPSDWGEGYGNVTLCSTCENQKMADFRLPFLMGLPAKRRQIICAPLLEEKGISLEEPVCFITNDFHCYRSAAYARRAGYRQVTCLSTSTPPTTLLSASMREALACFI